MSLPLYPGDRFELVEDAPIPGIRIYRNSTQLYLHLDGNKDGIIPASNFRDARAISNWIAGLSGFGLDWESDTTATVVARPI
jgi:hypothetical protein